MSPIIVDFSNIAGPEPLPVGEYLAKVVHAEEGLSAAQQSKIDLQWEVIAPEEYAGRRVFQLLSFHPDAVSRTKQMLIGMGFDRAYQGEVNAQSMMDRECAITLVIEAGKPMPEGEGEPGETYPDRNKVKKIRPAEKFGKQSVAAESLGVMELPPSEEAAPAGRRARR